MNFYTTPLWQETRRRKLARNPFCEYCEAIQIKTAAVAVDHIVAIAKGGHPTEPRNLRSCCLSHHNSKTAMEDMKGRPKSERIISSADGFPVEMGKGVRVVYADTNEERMKVLGELLKGKGNVGNDGSA